LLIAFPNADDPPSGNHESLESKIPKRKKARPNTRLSCKIEYFIETTSAYLSGRSAFFTDDFVASWRPINFNRPAIRVGGSPFKTFAEAEKACETMLAHLAK
jgi:hypothetical protein